MQAALAAVRVPVDHRRRLGRRDFQDGWTVGTSPTVANSARIESGGETMRIGRTWPADLTRRVLPSDKISGALTFRALGVFKPEIHGEHVTRQVGPLLPAAGQVQHALKHERPDRKRVGVLGPDSVRRQVDFDARVERLRLQAGLEFVPVHPLSP
jgi:hypothetical protein